MSKRFFIHELLGNIKVRTKFLLILILAMLLVFMSVRFTYRLPYAAYDETLYNNSVQMIILFAGHIQAELDEIEGLSYRVLSDNVLQKNLSIMKRTAQGTATWISAKEEVSDRVANYALWFSSSSGISIQLKTASGMFFGQFFHNPFAADELTEERIAYASGRLGRGVWLAEAGSPARLFLLREIREIEGMSLATLATMLVEMDLNGLIEKNRDAMNDMGSPLSCAIYDGDLCLYASDEIVRTLGEDVCEDGYVHETTNGSNQLCVRYTANNGWRYVTLIDYAEIDQTIQQAVGTALMINALVMLLALVLAILLIHSVLKHLEVLLHKFDLFAQHGYTGDDGASPYQFRGDEIGQLHRHFDKMTHDYRLMMSRSYEQQQLLQETQMQRIRAQVRPHFLYNTLESIYCLAEQAGNKRIAVMTDALGKMLRASLNDKRDVVTVAEDLQVAKEYLRIQQMRYDDHLRVTYEVEDAYMNLLIPSMTLQPLLENAIHHGLEEMIEVCDIRIAAQNTAGGIEVIIEDNGPGMDEDIINKLESGEIIPEGLGIGLRNIHRRIQYAFGNAYGIRVRRRQGRTCVAVYLPDTRNAGGDQHV